MGAAETDGAKAGARKRRKHTGAAEAAARMTDDGAEGGALHALEVARAAPEMSWRAARGKVEIACMAVRLVRRDDVRANNYNPNSVPPDKMELLAQSVADNGFCFPLVVIRDDEASGAEGRDIYVIVDGFHRWTVSQPAWLDIAEVPVVVLRHGMEKRLAATWQFNKARGSHRVDLDAELVRRLVDQGLSDEEVASKLGVELDTVHRYKQVTGVAALFSSVPYSTAWSMTDDPRDPRA